MSPTEKPAAFGRDHAGGYDAKRAQLAPVKDLLHLLTRFVFDDLGEEAHILCVGVGTGAEILALGAQFPKWRFTGVDPSAPMLEVCRQRLSAAGLSSRCELHKGYVDSLPEDVRFDAATSLLVSHFIEDKAQRTDFFRTIASRLRPNAYLVNADVSADASSPEYPLLLQVWVKALRSAGMDDEANRFEQGTGIAMLPPVEVAGLMTSAGFKDPVLFYQATLMHAWFCRVNLSPS